MTTYPNWRPGLEIPATRGFAITPSDAALLPNETRGLYVGTAGDVAVVLVDDTATVTFVGLVAGSVYPLRIKQVNSTNTTASNLVGLY